MPHFLFVSYRLPIAKHVVIKNHFVFLFQMNRIAEITATIGRLFSLTNAFKRLHCHKCELCLSTKICKHHTGTWINIWAEVYRKQLYRCSIKKYPKFCKKARFKLDCLLNMKQQYRWHFEWYWRISWATVYICIPNLIVLIQNTNLIIPPLRRLLNYLLQEYPQNETRILITSNTAGT